MRIVLTYAPVIIDVNPGDKIPTDEPTIAESFGILMGGNDLTEDMELEVTLNLASVEVIQ